MSAAEIQPMFFDEEGGSDLEIQFDPHHFKAVTPYSEDLDLEDEYEQAQDQLRILKQREEQIRRQAEELEELSRQEEAFRQGRAAVTESLNRHLELFEREANVAQRRSEECFAAHERIESHLSSIASLRPETWSRADRKSELTRALSSIEAAEEEIQSLLHLVGEGSRKGWFVGLLGGSSKKTGPLPQGDFRYWLKSGFAFSLPLVGFALIAIVILAFL